MVQWLRLHTANEGDRGLIPGQGTKILHAMWYSQKKSWASLIAQLLKNLPAMQDTRVRFLSCEDPLEKEMAIHSSILVWRIPQAEEPGGLQSTGSQKSRTRLSTSTRTHRSFSSSSHSLFPFGIHIFVLHASISALQIRSFIHVSRVHT